MSALSDYLTPDTVRRAILDTTARMSQGDLDLTHSDEELMEAMVACARRYHTIAPAWVDRQDPARLPADSSLFIDGVISELLLSYIHSLAKDDVDFSAGGVTGNLTAARSRQVKELFKLHVERFERAASERKLSIQAHRMFAQIG